MAVIGLHLDGEHYQSDGTHTIAAQVGLAMAEMSGDVHNHGPGTLNVASVTFTNHVNCTAEITTGEPGLIGEYAADEEMQFIFEVTPTAYGAYSFDVVVTSDADTPVLTVSFEGYAVAPPDNDKVSKVSPRLTFSKTTRRITIPKSPRRILVSKVQA
jgi:hypothetical protein